MGRAQVTLSDLETTDYFAMWRDSKGRRAKVATLATLLSEVATYIPTVTLSSLTATAVTGALTGNVTGFQTLPSATAYTGADAGTLAISPAAGRASMTKSDGVGAYTLAAPGAGNVGKILVIENGVATRAHVVTVSGLAGGNTLTFTAAVGAAATLYAVSATVWGIIGLGGATQSQVG